MKAGVVGGRLLLCVRCGLQPAAKGAPAAGRTWARTNKKWSTTLSRVQETRDKAGDRGIGRVGQAFSFLIIKQQQLIPSVMFHNHRTC